MFDVILIGGLALVCHFYKADEKSAANRGESGGDLNDECNGENRPDCGGDGRGDFSRSAASRRRHGGLKPPETVSPSDPETPAETPAETASEPEPETGAENNPPATDKKAA